MKNIKILCLLPLIILFGSDQDLNRSGDDVLFSKIASLPGPWKNISSCEID
jgi:hypothetical protein